MSTKLEQFLKSNKFKVDKKGLISKVRIKQKQGIKKLLNFANSEHTPIYFNYSDKIESFPKSKDDQFLFLILSNFNKIHEINITNRYAIVEPGVKAKYLNQILKKDNFTFLPYSDSSELTIGEMIFNNVIGKNQVQTIDSILGLEVILPNGEVVRTGSKTLKSVSGYDITSLYVGSQGIFGIVIKATLRIDPIVNFYKYKEDESSSIEIPSRFTKNELIILRKIKKVLDPENILNPDYLI